MLLFREVSSMNRSEAYELLARGSIGHPPSTTSPRPGRRAWLWAEMVVFFVAVPILMRWAIHDQHIPLVLVLQPLLLGFILYLLWDDTFHLKGELARGFAWR